MRLVKSTGLTSGCAICGAGGDQIGRISTMPGRQSRWSIGVTLQGLTAAAWLAAGAVIYADVALAHRGSQNHAGSVVRRSSGGSRQVRRYRPTISETQIADTAVAGGKEHHSMAYGSPLLGWLRQRHRIPLLLLPLLYAVTQLSHSSPVLAPVA